MSAKTKIIILRSKNLIWGATIAVIVILIIILLISAFSINKKESRPAQLPEKSTSTVSVPISREFTPGVYSTSLIPGSADFQLIVRTDRSHICSVGLYPVSETVEAMYPVITPVLNSLEAQLISCQDISRLTYSSDTRYTAECIIQAISYCLELASASAS